MQTKQAAGPVGTPLGQAAGGGEYGDRQQRAVSGQAFPRSGGGDFSATKSPVLRL